MSSINLYPTFEYSQPSEYHFSHDSVFFARRVFEYLQQSGRRPESVLDLCAGCGVIGLDFLFHRRMASQSLPSRLDFLEVQDQYRPHFDENFRRLGSVPSKVSFIKGNYAEKNISFLADNYDLIVCNPPYFSTDQGKLPPSELKLRSRFFVDSDLKSLIEFIHGRLSIEGQAFVLIRNQLEHKQNQLSTVQDLCAGKLKMAMMDDIRGTDVVLLSRN